MNYIAKLWSKLFGAPRAPAPKTPPVRDDEASTDHGYSQLPGSRQWSPPEAPNPVNEEGWKACHHCGRKIPVVIDEILENGQIKSLGTWTYVCPFCDTCHTGTPVWTE